MNTSLSARTLTYLGNVLGISANFGSFDQASSFPAYLRESYEIVDCEILGTRLLVLFSRDTEFTPASIEKHVDWIRQKTNRRSIFVSATLEPYNRKRLIERKIPFIVPGNQLYLPDLGLDLREQFKRILKPITKLSPASQVVTLACLLRKIDPSEELTAGRLAERFRYTKMTMIRVLDELRTVQLVHRENEGRNGPFKFALTGKELWKAAQPHLRSPVRKRIYLDEWFSGLDFLAGEAALEKRTLIGFPRRTAWAVTNAEWKQLQRSPDIRIIPEVSKEMAHAEFELWRYDPRLLAEKPTVDPLSLALSFNDTPDERLSMAVDELLRSVPW